MIKDTEIRQHFEAVATLDQEKTPVTDATGVRYKIKPNLLTAIWIKENGSKWQLESITVTGPRVLKGDAISDAVIGLKKWWGNPTGNHQIDPPSWVLSIINEMKPNGWELTS